MFVSALKKIVFANVVGRLFVAFCIPVFGTLFSTILYIKSKHGLCAQMVECESNCRYAHNEVNREKKENYSRMSFARIVTNFVEMFYKRVW